ncbi:hypothetical protein IPU53_12350 [Bacillus sp. SD088]|nr:hypothetical protein [Bacillus sp. SD088]
MMKSNVQVLPIIASIGVGAVAYSMMTGKAGQLQNMIPQLSGMSQQGSSQQQSGMSQQGGSQQSSENTSSQMQ